MRLPVGPPALASGSDRPVPLSLITRHQFGNSASLVSGGFPRDQGWSICAVCRQPRPSFLPRLPFDWLTPPCPVRAKRGRLSDTRIRRVLELMEREYASRLTASQLAGVVGLSRSRFEHLFKAETGARLRPALRQIRLQRAQALLAKSSLSIKEIACRVGFLSTSGFARAFARRYGQAPCQWRRRQSQIGIARLDNK